MSEKDVLTEHVSVSVHSVVEVPVLPKWSKTNHFPSEDAFTYKGEDCCKVIPSIQPVEKVLLSNKMVQKSLSPLIQ